MLARKLGVSRGSFYWHFTDLGAFHALVIEHWKQIATEAIIADVERFQSGEERLEALGRHGFGHGAALEIRMRAWADSNAEAARAVSDIDRRRQEYIEQLLVGAGIAPPLAATRAQLLMLAGLAPAGMAASFAARSKCETLEPNLKEATFGLMHRSKTRHYSITSSASCWSCHGTCRSSAFAVELFKVAACYIEWNGIYAALD